MQWVRYWSRELLDSGFTHQFVVRQGCLLSPTLFNIFLEDIMTHALENYNGTISIGGRQITNLRFADDIDGITGEEDELTKLVHNLDTAAAKFGMGISTEINQDNDT